ncbi:hypothetical protein PG997_014892 [Apiospora hydei]|uniref:F-box domain-containing protein n=1 Tax=Apiospora hydei TaxID=1337664 RepID=A0ABR1UXL6_9PEZI
MSLVPVLETAAQKALRIPEIVAMIAEALCEDDLDRRRKHRLKRFIRVNRVWFDAGVRLLWRNMNDQFLPDLVGIFFKIDPPRRPIYAAFIQDAAINLERAKDPVRWQLLRHIDFPMLRMLRVDLMVPYYKKLPLLGKHIVRVVHLENFCSPQVTTHMTRNVIKQCLESFPDLQELHFRYPAQDRIRGRALETGKTIFKMLEDAGFEKVYGLESPYKEACFRRATS